MNVSKDIVRYHHREAALYEISKLRVTRMFSSFWTQIFMVYYPVFKHINEQIIYEFYIYRDK
jgi:hypothetical protein